MQRAACPSQTGTCKHNTQVQYRFVAYVGSLHLCVSASRTFTNIASTVTSVAGLPWCTFNMLWLQVCKKTTYLQTFLYRLAVKWLWIASRRWGTLSGLAACARLASTRRVNQGKLY